MALVVALIIMIVLTLIGLASTFTSTFEIMLSGEKRRSTDAFYAADSGGNVVILNYQNFVPNSTDYDPFTNPANSKPTPHVAATVKFDPLKMGPPEGESFNNDYAYFWVESTGNDGTGTAIRSTSTVNLNVFRILAKSDSSTEIVVTP